jgi:hypothetical protein
MVPCQINSPIISAFVNLIADTTPFHAQPTLKEREV